MRAMGTEAVMRAALGLALLSAAACWGEVAPVWPDGPPDSDTGTAAGPEPIPGGGLRGGPLDGRLDLFLFDEETGEPVAGARALLVAGALTLTAETGVDGHVAFVDAALAGPAGLHVLADGFVAGSFLDLDAAEATLPLRPVEQASPPPAMLSGTVSGFEALPQPTATQRHAALVTYGPRFADLASAREPLIGAPVPRQIVLVLAGEPAFELAVPPVPGVLHVLIGLAETFGTPDASDDAYDWRLFAALQGLDPQPGEALPGLQVTVGDSLPVLFHATLNAFPSAYERAGIELAFDLGDQGTVWIPGTRQGGKWVFAAPEQAGLLAPAVPFVVARGDQAVTPEEGAAEVDAAPLGRYVARNPGPLQDFPLVSPFLVPGMPSPPAQVGFDGQAFHCLPMAGTDLAHFTIADAATGAERWRVMVFGELPGSAPLPPFPEDWGFAGIPEGGLLIRAWTAAFTADPAELHFSSYQELVREVAFEAVEVE